MREEEEEEGGKRSAICRSEAEPTRRRGIGKLVIKQLVIREESHASLSPRSRGISMQMWALRDARGVQPRGKNVLIYCTIC